MPDKPWRSAPVAGALCSIYLCAMQQSPKLADLRAFAALADTGSFREAGKRLGRDPTVLSRSIRSLERQLGVRLAEWTTRVVTLTEAGSVYASRVRGLLQELEAASQEAAAFGQGEPQGHLRVALPGSFARLWMAPLMTGFLQAHPRVTLEAHYSNAFVDIVTQGFDLAVRLAELPDSRLIARKIASRRRLVCASPGYLAKRGVPTTPEDLAEHDCLCFTGRDEPYLWTFQNKSGTRQSVVIRRRAASDDADVLVEAAAAGLGLFYTTDWHVGPLLADGRLFEVMADWPVADGGGIFILTNSAVRMPSKTRAFSDWIAKGLAKRPWIGA
jgi:DNA-binding transcriptional LysR family regulator